MRAMYPDEIRECPALASGETVNGWLVDEEIGAGGFATVFKVRKKTPKGEIVGALKICSVEGKRDKDLRKEAWRFKQEIEILTKADGQFAPKLYESGTHAGVPYFVMEYFLPVKPSKMPSTDEGITELMLHLTDALAQLHDRGWVHCDIKPHNIAKRADGQYVLIDFGAANRMDAAGVDQHQVDACSRNFHDGKYHVAESKYYAPPEVLFQPCRDIYALGHLLRDCFQEDVPFEWSMIINKCISWQPKYRYPTVAKLRDDIQNLKKIRSTVYWNLRKKKIQEQRQVERSLLKAVPRTVRWDEILEEDKARTTKSLTVYKIKLDRDEGKVYCFTIKKPLRLKENTVLLISGEGVLRANISGPSSSIVVIRKHAAVNNLTSGLPPKNELLYAIVGPGGYLNFSNIKEKDRPKFFPKDGRRRIFRDIDATTAFRFGGPDTFAGVEGESLDGLRKSDIPKEYREHLLEFFKGESFNVFPPRN